MVEWVVANSVGRSARGPRRWHSIGGLEISRKSQDAAGRTVPGVKADKNAILQETKVHLKCTHSQQIQHLH